MNLDYLDRALAIRATYKIKFTIDKILQSKESENEKINTLFAIDIVDMSAAHIMYTSF